MKISINTYDAFRFAGIDGGVRLIAEAGFDCMDVDLCFMLSYGDICEGRDSQYLSMDDDALWEVMKPQVEAAQKYHVAIGQAHAIYPTYVANSHSNENVVNMLKKQIRLCDQIGCPYLIVHPGQPTYEDLDNAQQVWDINMNLFSQLIPTLQKSNTIVCIENIFLQYKSNFFGTVCGDPNALCRCIDMLNESAGKECFAFCLDTGHTLLTGHEIGTTIKTMGHRLQALHLNDNDRTDDLHVMPYMGRLDWERMCDALHSIGYSNTINFELLLAKDDMSLVPECMKYTAAAGRLFASRISAEGNETL